MDGGLWLEAGDSQAAKLLLEQLLCLWTCQESPRGPFHPAPTASGIARHHGSSPQHCYRKTISACLLACLAQRCSRETTQHVQINTQPNMLKRVVAVSIRAVGGLAGPTRRPHESIPLTSRLKPFRDHEVAAAVKGS